MFNAIRRLRMALGVPALAQELEAQAARLEALEALATQHSATLGAHDATAAKAVLAADLAQRAERRVLRLVRGDGGAGRVAGGGVGDRGRVGLDSDIETLDT